MSDVRRARVLFVNDVLSRVQMPMVHPRVRVGLVSRPPFPYCSPHLLVVLVVLIVRSSRGRGRCDASPRAVLIHHRRPSAIEPLLFGAAASAVDPPPATGSSKRGGNIVIARGGRSGMIPPDGWFPDGWFPDGWFPRRTLARRFDFVVVVRLFDIGGGDGAGSVSSRAPSSASKPSRARDHVSAPISAPFRTSAPPWRGRGFPEETVAGSRVRGGGVSAQSRASASRPKLAGRSPRAHE